MLNSVQEELVYDIIKNFRENYKELRDLERVQICNLLLVQRVESDDFTIALLEEEYDNMNYDDQFCRQRQSEILEILQILKSA